MDIPETVWAEAKKVANDIAWNSHHDMADAELIARAIMAERDRCAAIATEYSEFHAEIPALSLAGSAISQAIRNTLHKQT